MKNDVIIQYFTSGDQAPTIWTLTKNDLPRTKFFTCKNDACNIKNLIEI